MEIVLGDKKMEEKTYTARQVAQMFGKEPKEINARIKKGGIKGVVVTETDDGFQYMLTDKSIDQLGALFGLTPKKIENTENAQMVKSVDFDGVKLKAELTKQGIKGVIVARAIGKADNYISNAIERNRMNQEAADEMNRIFGIDVRKFELKSEPKKPKASEKAVESTIGLTAEEIRSAVYNGMIDAMLMFMKEDTVKNMILRIMNEQEFRDACQDMLFRSMNGVRRLMDKEAQSMHAGLVPQNGVRR